MCKSWCQPFILGAHHYFDFIGHGVGSSFLAAICFVFVCLFVCLFVFFQLLRWVILFLSLTSGWGFLVFCFCFVLFCFSFKMFHFPTIYLGSDWFFFSVLPVGKVFCFLLFLFVCLLLFCFVLFLLFFASKNFIPPLISNGAPLSLFYYTNDGGHYVIDNLEFPWRACNSVKNLIH